MSAGHHARERETADRRPLVIGLVVLAVLLAALVTWRARATPAAVCASGPSATIVAAPDIAPALAEVTAAMADEGWCADITVRAEDSSTVFERLVVDAAEAPNLWVPDSGLWVDQLVTDAVPSEVLSPAVATSPVVLAGGPSAVSPESWFAALSSGRVVVQNPQQQAASALALIAPRAERQESGASVEEIRAELVPMAQRHGERSTTSRSVAQALAGVTTTTKRLVPVTEQAWLRARRSNREVTAVVPATGTLFQRYPLVGLPGRSDSSDAAVLQFLDYLARPQAAVVLSEHDFRAGGGEALPDGVGAGAVSGLERPPAQEVQADLRMWEVLTVPSSILAVVDASGSMDFRAGARTRMELAMSAAGTALHAFPGNARVGLWLFSIGLGEGTDHRELVPLRRLDTKTSAGTQRELLGSWLSRSVAVTEGGTGLYDTTLEAFRSAQDDYDPDYFNAVVLMSDGANDDTGSIRLGDLLTALRDEADPDRPVRIITIGISEDADMAALSRISAATNGTAHEASDPRDILDVMSGALLAR